MNLTELLNRFELCSAEIYAKDTNEKPVIINLNRNDLEMLKEYFYKLSLERNHYRVLAQKLRQDKKRLQDTIEYCNCCKEVDSEW